MKGTKYGKLNKERKKGMEGRKIDEGEKKVKGKRMKGREKTGKGRTEERKGGKKGGKNR